MTNGPVPTVNVPLSLFVKNPRPGQWYNSWDGKPITKADLKRRFVPVPYHSILRVYMGKDRAKDNPVKYVF